MGISVIPSLTNVAVSHRPKVLTSCHLTATLRPIMAQAATFDSAATHRRFPHSAQFLFAPSADPSPHLIESKGRLTASYSIQETISNAPKSLKTITGTPLLIDTKPHVFEERAKPRPCPLISLPYPAPQLIENPARRRPFYSRLPRLEVYENKGQTAVLLAPKNRFFAPSPLLPDALGASVVEYSPSGHLHTEGTRLLPIPFSTITGRTAAPSARCTQNRRNR